MTRRPTPAAVAESLRNIARANRWFGGAAAVRFGLARTLAGVPRGTTLSLLDLGTGLGDLPRVAVRWGAARGIRMVPLGLELNRVAAALACAWRRSHGARLCRGATHPRQERGRGAGEPGGAPPDASLGRPSASDL